MLAKAVHRDVHRPGNGSQRILLLGSDIEQEELLGIVANKLAPVNWAHLSSEDILGHVPRNVYRIFGRRVRRRVGMLDIHQVVDRTVILDDGGQHVQALVGAIVAHHLSAVELTRFGRVHNLDGHWNRPRIVPRVRGRVGRRFEVRYPLALERLPGNARRTYGDIEHLGNGRSNRALVGNPISKDDIVGTDAPLTVGRPCQVGYGWLLGNWVDILDGIAHRVDVGIGGLQVLVYLDATRYADVEPSILGQLIIGTNADG